MPNPSTLEMEDQEADVHRPQYHCSALGHARGTEALWEEVKALTAQVADLESQLAAERERSAAFLQEANRLRLALGRALTPDSRKPGEPFSD